MGFWYHIDDAIDNAIWKSLVTCSYSVGSAEGGRPRNYTPTLSRCGGVSYGDVGSEVVCMT